MSLATKKVGTLKCSFEVLISTEKEIIEFSQPLRTKYHPITGYYLYLFKKNSNGEFSLCWNYDEEPAKISTEQGSNNLSLCDYSFNRSENYYVYFSGKKINKTSIDLLKTTDSYKLIKIAPKGNGRIRIEQSLFYWISLVQVVEDKISDKSKLLETLIKIYDEENFSLSGSDSNAIKVIQEIRDNRILIFSNGNIMDVHYFLKGALNEVNNETSLWIKIFEKIENESEKLYNSSEKIPGHDSYDFENIRNYVSDRDFSAVNIIGAMHGYVFNDSLNDSNKNSSDSFERYFIAANRDELLQLHFPSYKIIDTLGLGNQISSYARSYNGKTIKAEYKNNSVVLTKCNFLTLGTKYRPSYTSILHFSYTYNNKTSLIEITRSKNKIQLKENNNFFKEITVRQAKVDISIYRFMKRVRDDLSRLFDFLVKEDPSISKIPDMLIDLKNIFNN